VKRKKKEKRAREKMEAQADSVLPPQVDAPLPKVEKLPRFAEAKPRRLARVKEACAYGKISRTHLYRRLRDQTIKGYKLGSRTMIDLDSIDSMNESLRPWTPRDG